MKGLKKPLKEVPSCHVGAVKLQALIWASVFVHASIRCTSLVAPQLIESAEQAFKIFSETVEKL